MLETEGLSACYLDAFHEGKKTWLKMLRCMYRCRRSAIIQNIFSLHMTLRMRTCLFCTKSHGTPPCPLRTRTFRKMYLSRDERPSRDHLAGQLHRRRGHGMIDNPLYYKCVLLLCCGLLLIRPSTFFLCSPRPMRSTRTDQLKSLPEDADCYTLHRDVFSK